MEKRYAISVVIDMEDLLPEMRAELSLQMMGEWWVIALTGLFRTVDFENALECIKPYFRQSGMEAGFYTKDDARFGESSLENIAHNIGIGLGNNRIPCEVEMVGEGVVVTMPGCWATSTGIQEAVCRLHEIHLNGLCEAIDPEFAACITQMATPDMPFCKAVIRKNTVPVENWQDYGPVVGVMPKAEIPNEITNSRPDLLLDAWLMTVNGFVDEAGKDAAIGILRPCMIKSGISWGMKLAGSNQFVNAESGVAHLVEIFSNIMHLEGDVKVTKGRVDKAIGACKLAKESKEACVLFDSFVEGLCLSVDPEMRLIHRRIECEPLPVCHWIFKKQDKDEIVGPWSSVVSMEPRPSK